MSEQTQSSTERTIETVKAELDANRTARHEAKGQVKGMYTKAVKKLEAELAAMEPQEGEQQGEQPPQQQGESSDTQQQDTSDEQADRRAKKQEQIDKLVASGMSVQAARKQVNMRTVHATPDLIEALSGKELTIEELAEATSHEVTPSLKRRVGWLTDKDEVLVRKVTGKGKNKKVTYTAKASS